MMSSAERRSMSPAPHITDSRRLISSKHFAPFVESGIISGSLFVPHPEAEVLEGR